MVLSLALGCSERTDPGDPSGTIVEGSRLALLAPGERGGPPPSLRNIWPNEDGRAWTYRLDQRVWDLVEPPTYSTPEEVPPIPSLDEVAALLGNHPIGSNPVADAAGYRMQFNGMKTTESGAVGQSLETEVFDLATTSTGSIRHSMVPDAGFWRSLARARPDLAPRIAGRLGQEAARLAAPVEAAEVDPPLYLFGYAWEKTREYIGSYGDLNTILSWKYLEADLTPGHEFTIQLVPDLADNVFLHVRVLAERAATTVLGEHPHSIDVLYVVDYGVGDYSGGSVPGFAHAYDYGTITYAPKVGPVASYERNIIYTGEPIHPGYRELRGEVAAVVPGRGPLP
jgi:hypothetical protein